MKKNINLYKMIQKIENKEIREDAEKILIYAITNNNFTEVATNIIETDLPSITKLIDDGVFTSDELMDKIISVIKMSLDNNIESINEIQGSNIIMQFTISVLNKFYPLDDSIIKNNLVITQTKIENMNLIS